MYETSIITSLQNARVKDVCRLQEKSQERRRTGRFVVEGRRELQRCVAAGYEVETLMLCAELAEGFALAEARETLYVSPAVDAKMAYRGTTEGALGIVRDRPLALQDIPLGAAPLIVVLESVEKPGNLGAVLRSADAAGTTAVVVCDEVGSGVIPLEKRDREAREATGRLCVLLAREAERVVRVVAGIPVVLKG